MWSSEPVCKKCNKKLNISFGDDKVVCEDCGGEYIIENNGISYAIAESGSATLYDYKEEGVIERRAFSNIPVDILEEAWQDINALSDKEINPHKLIPVIKKYHDALRKRLQVFLTLDHIPNLTQQEKNRIKNDRPMLNLKDLINFLRRAFHSNTVQIDSVLVPNQSMINKILWIRHKSEHTSPKIWSAPAKVFEDLSKQPDSPDRPDDILDFDFIKRTNKTIIDICLLIISLDPTPKDAWRISVVERFRYT